MASPNNRYGLFGLVCRSVYHGGHERTDLVSYRHATRRPEHADLASGSVLHSLPGRPAFPVRLATELLLRCAELRPGDEPAVVWDPCCGGGSLLTSLGFLHPELIAGLIGSDADPDATGLAGRNLALLSPGGLDARVAQLRDRLAVHGRPSYAEAIERAGRLRARLGEATPPGRVFTADATDPVALRAGLGEDRPGIVLTDVPYGRSSSWAGPGVGSLLEALRKVLPADAVVAVVSDKGQRLDHDGFRRLTRLKIGHRHAVIVTPSA